MFHILMACLLDSSPVAFRSVDSLSHHRFHVCCLVNELPVPLDLEELPYYYTCLVQHRLYIAWRQHLLIEQYNHGWSDGRYATWIEACDDAIDYWRACGCVREGGQPDWWQKKIETDLMELPGRWWGYHSPPLLPEPIRVMPRAANAAGTH